MFSDCKTIKEIDLSSFNTSKVSNFEEIFFYCDSLHRVDISSFHFGKNVQLFNVHKADVGVVIVNKDIEKYIKDQVSSNWIVFVKK